MSTTPDGRHRKALRSAALDMHKMASAIRERRGRVPADEPAGYLDAFAAALRERARLLERLSRSASCAAAKREATGMMTNDTPQGRLAGRRATMALMVMVNLHAGRAGVDPYRDGTEEGR